MKRPMVIAAVFLLTLALVMLPVGQARAQEPGPTETPTITPTPAYIQVVPLSSGNTLRVERSISYGDAAIVVMLLVIWITYTLANAVKIPRSFTQR